MNADYIAGFFDGEGSAMIITVKRKYGERIIYRFRPVIKIAQKNKRILTIIKDYFHFGHVDAMYCNPYLRHQYIINGLDGVISFAESISSSCFTKNEILELIKEFALYQKARWNRGKTHYNKEELFWMIDMRDKLFDFNGINRSNMKQKYPKDIILSTDWRLI